MEDTHTKSRDAFSNGKYKLARCQFFSTGWAHISALHQQCTSDGNPLGENRLTLWHKSSQVEKRAYKWVWPLTIICGDGQKLLQHACHPHCGNNCHSLSVNINKKSSQAQLHLNTLLMNSNWPMPEPEHSWITESFLDTFRILKRVLDPTYTCIFSRRKFFLCLPWQKRCGDSCI